MNINLMRHIDFWIGIPLCLLLSIWSLITRPFQSKKDASSAQPKKFLFIKLSEMGAIIVAHPLLKKLEQQYPGASFHFLTFANSQHVLKLLPGMVKEENTWTIRENNPLFFVTDTIKVIFQLRQQNYDVTFDLEFFSRFTALLTYLSGAPKRVGFYRYFLEGLYRGNLLTHKILYNPLIHTSKTYLSLAQVIRTKRKNSPELNEINEQKDLVFPKISPTELGQSIMMDRLIENGYDKEKPLFLINAGEGMIPLREWPLESFVSLCDKILKDENNFVALVGIKSKNKKDEQLEAALNNNRCLNLTGQTSVHELLELFYMAEALIINDCGLAHLASLTNIKKFILFGPESPQIFAPLTDNTWILYSGLYCSPCLSVLNHRNSACRDNQCLKVITPDHVYDTVMRQCAIQNRTHS